VTKEFYNTVYQEGHPSRYGVERISGRTTRLQRITKAWLDSTRLMEIEDADILEIGCGMACLSTIHSGWHGTEYSQTAVERVKAIHGPGTKIYQADAQCLPFDDSSFQGVFTWATLEHVPNPHKALCEINRILLGGGHAFIAPAWHCRSWTVIKLPNRPYRELGWKDKLDKALIPLRESIFVRALVELPNRIAAEIAMLYHSEMKLRYKVLSPRWDLIEKYGHSSDDDAVADIDPHAVICFFKSRGYEILSHPSILSRLTARYEPVSVRKPKTI
jgi:SAM-dependent methyltransferase